MIYIKTYWLLVIFEFTIICSHHHVNGSPEMEVKNWCYMPKAASDGGNKNCPFDGDKIQVNFKQGVESDVVVAEFLLAPPSCPQIEYRIDVLVDGTGKNDQMCNESSSRTHHSLKKFKIIQCENDSCPDACEKYGSISFSNVKSGCYKTDIQQFTKPRYSIDRSSTWKYIETNYTGSWQLQAFVDKHYDQPSQVMNINLTFSKPTSKVMLMLKCNNSITKKKIIVNRLSENNDCQLQNRNDPGNLHKFDWLSCKFSNITLNAYTLQVTALNDEQCDEEMHRHGAAKQICWKEQTFSLNAHSQENVPPFNNGVTILTIVVFIIILLIGLLIWHLSRRTRNKKRNSILEGLNAHSQENVPPFNNGVTILTIVVFIIILLIGLLIWHLSRRTRNKKRNSILEAKSHLLEVSALNNNCEILLLYARDCEHFMNAMKSFSLLLEEVCHIKVHDCFDHLNWEDDLLSPVDWLERIIKWKPHIQIVIVSSHCAYIQQQMLLSGGLNLNSSLFKEPSYLDNLFVYGLKILRDYEISNAPQQRTFIIRLNGFSDEVNLNMLPSLSTVYQIPLHFNELFRDLGIAEFRGDSKEIDNFKKHGMYTNFVNNLEKLRRFEGDHQNYLEEILNISVTPDNSSRILRV